MDSACDPAAWRITGSAKTASRAKPANGIHSGHRRAAPVAATALGRTICPRLQSISASEAG